MIERRIYDLEQSVVLLGKRTHDVSKKVDMVLLYLQLITQQNRKIMADETQVLSDLSVITDNLTAIGNDQKTIAQELSDLKDDGMSAETKAKISDIAARSTAAAAAIHALVPAPVVAAPDQTA